MISLNQMKKSQIIFLQGVVAVIGLFALAFLLVEPHFEGRNADATFSQVYFNDPFLVCVYIASIFFFMALYQGFKILGNVKNNQTFSEATVKSLRKIRYCAITLVGFVLAGEAYLFLFQRGKDDIAGGVFMGLLLIAAFGITSTVANMFERIVQNASGK